MYLQDCFVDPRTLMESSVGLKKVEVGVDVEIVLVIVMMATRRDRHQL